MQANLFALCQWNLGLLARLNCIDMLGSSDPRFLDDDGYRSLTLFIDKQNFQISFYFLRRALYPAASLRARFADDFELRLATLDSFSGSEMPCRV